MKGIDADPIAIAGCVNIVYVLSAWMAACPIEWIANDEDDQWTECTMHPLDWNWRMFTYRVAIQGIVK